MTWQQALGYTGIVSITWRPAVAVSGTSIRAAADDINDMPFTTPLSVQIAEW